MKKRILLLTGRIAEEAVKDAVESSPIPVEVHVCGLDVASFLSPKAILEELSFLDLREVSLILAPGCVPGDLSGIGEKLKVPCVKGPRNLSDLPLVLELLSESNVRLSAKEPADSLIEEEIKKRVDSELEEARFSRGGGLAIGERVFLGTKFLHVVAEIPSAPRLTDEELAEKARYYVDSGASIVDLGMVFGEDNSSGIPRIVSAVKDAIDSPVSIDSLLPEEILSAVDYGIDLVLSLDYTNYGLASSLDVPAVVIPRDSGGVPRKPLDRVKSLEDLIKKLDSMGFDRCIADLVLDPPLTGFTSSLQAYSLFRERNSDVPLLFGAGNVSELLDADSPGVNALLAAAAAELKADLIFSTEASFKNRGAVRELSRAAEMMFLAGKRGQPPKDLGVDLLVLKDKMREETPVRAGEEFLKSIKAASSGEYALEDCSFAIRVSDKIELVFYRGNEPKLKFVGASAEALYKEVFFRGLVKSLTHAAYLGRELEKAEIALKLGKNYVQDQELF